MREIREKERGGLGQLENNRVKERKKEIRKGEEEETGLVQNPEGKKLA